MSISNPYYILGPDNVPRVIYDITEWAVWFSTHERRIAFTDLGIARVSTVFLGLDHGFMSEPDADPILFETMVFFDTSEDQYQERFAFWPEAEEGHKRIVAIFKARLERAEEISYEALRMDLEKEQK